MLPNDADPASQLLTLAEAEKRLRISRYTLYKIMRSGRLKTVRIEGRRFITEAACREYLRAQTKAS